MGKWSRGKYSLVRCLVDAVASFCVTDCAVGAEIESFGCAVTVHGCFLCLIEKDMNSDRVNREIERKGIV
jgi:hypothetical protein